MQFNQLAFLLMAPQGGQGADSGSQMLSTGIMFGSIIFIFYFMIYRPQRKRQKEREALIGGMQKGDKVITSGGMHGTISAIEENSILVQVAETTKIRFEKSAITTVLPK
jgi:preprotein translocase subunit YajC